MVEHRMEPGEEELSRVVSLRRLVDAIASGLSRHWVVCLILLSALYVAGACGKAISKPFWFDELFTWHLARLPSLPDLWQALLRGTDSNPPLGYFPVRLSHALFGEGEFASRIPSLICFWLATACLFRFLAYRCGKLVALTGVLFFLHTAAYRYAYEVRPYAQVLLCCGISLLCWSRATDRRPRRLPALLGLGLALAVGLHTHYYAVLLFAPLAAGEAVRSIREKRIDLPVWIAMAVAGATLVVLVPHMRAFSAYSEGFWTETSLPALASTVSWLFGTEMLVLVYATVVAGSLVCLSRSGVSKEEPAFSPKELPLHELVAVGVLALLPVVGWVVARLVTNAFTGRYLLPAMIGLSVLLAYMVGRSLRWSRAPAVVLIAVLGAAFAARQIQQARGFLKGPPAHKALHALEVETQPETGPIVVSPAFYFLEVHHYASEAVKPRLVYVANIEESFRHCGSDTADRAIIALSRVAGLPVRDYESFTSTHSKFFAYDHGNRGWFVPKLVADGAQVALVARKGERMLTSVSIAWE